MGDLAMIKTLTKHGNSYALVIEKPILELLRIGPETSFEIVTDGQCLVLTPLRDAEEEKRFESALGRVHRRFGRAMKRLAE
jgi:antitoxin component of MazEF toxin-antitoxin module